MTRKTSIIAALCLTLALCLALAGCAGVDKTKYLGEWKLSQGSAEDLDAESVELMESLGYEVVLVLNEDGTGSLDLFGDESPVSWSASSDAEGKLSVDGSGDSTMKLDGDVLTLTDSAGETMTFGRAS